MLTYVLDQRILHILRIGNLDTLSTIAGVHLDGRIVEHRETELALITNQQDSVVASRLVTYKTP